MSTQGLVEALRHLCEWAEQIQMAYAWITSDSGKAEHWRILQLEKVSRAIVGIHFNQTEPEALRTIHRCRPEALRIVNDAGGVFHPKVILGLKADQVKALTGSSNLTIGGYGGNTELNLLVEGQVWEEPIQALIRFIEEAWSHPRTFSFNEAWYRAYEEDYRRRPKPKPSRNHEMHPRDEATLGLTGLDVNWTSFFGLIAKQERRLLSNGNPIHVFDHPDGSYLQEIERCQRAFEGHPSFASMPLEDRKLVAGFGSSSGYYGRMVGAGNFKEMVIRAPETLGVLLDQLPTAGPIELKKLKPLLEKMLGLKGSGMATTTRLLVAKRPDLFLSVNNASRSRIHEVFGNSPKGADGYLALIQQIWGMPWFRSSMPLNLHEARIWKARTAILDALLYQVAD